MDFHETLLIKLTQMSDQQRNIGALLSQHGRNDHRITYWAQRLTSFQKSNVKKSEKEVFNLITNFCVIFK